MIFYGISAGQKEILKGMYRMKKSLTSVVDWKPEEVITSFGCSVWIDKMYSSHWYKVAEVTALQNYSCT